MNCIFCGICKDVHAALDRKLDALWEEQSNHNEILTQNDEATRQRMMRAYNLLDSDPEEAFREYLAMAENGSIWCMSSVAGLFRRGRGTQLDLMKAEAWYRRAVEGGYDNAVLLLGRFYLNQGDFEKAMAVYLPRAEAKWPPAMVSFALVYMSSATWRDKRDVARRLLEEAAERGDLVAKKFLAIFTMRGRFGITKVLQGFRMQWQVAGEMAEIVADDPELLAAMEARKNKRAFLFFRCGPRVSLLNPTAT